MPADGGTAGIVSESVGWGRRIGEGPRDYAHRLHQAVQGNNYHTISVPLGFCSSHHGQPAHDKRTLFLWETNIGAPLMAALRQLEKHRDQTTKQQRYVTLVRSYWDSLKSAPPLTVIIDGEEQTVVEAYVLKAPFKSIPVLTLPYWKRNLLIIIPYGDVFGVVTRMLMDTACLAVGLRPLAHGIRIEPIQENGSVIFEGKDTKTVLIDSELCQLDFPLEVYANGLNSNYSILLQRR